MLRPGFDPGPLQVASQIGRYCGSESLLAHLATETSQLALLKSLAWSCGIGLVVKTVPRLEKPGLGVAIGLKPCSLGRGLSSSSLVLGVGLKKLVSAKRLQKYMI